MKTLITNYTFNAASKTITFSDYTSIDLNRVLLITNSTTNTIIYNFASSTLGGTVSGNTLTLTYNTGSMSNADKLQIYYDTEYIPASDQLLNALFNMVKHLEVLSQAKGILADIRVTPTATPNMSTLSTLSNIGSIGSYSASSLVKSFDNISAINSNINNVN
jgi:hypothetical protein